MANKFRKRVLTSGLAVLWMLLAPLAPTVHAGDPPQPLGIQFIVPDGEPMNPPVVVRSIRYRDEDELPFCLELPPDTWVTLFRGAFSTLATTNYIEIDWTGLFTTVSGSGSIPGIQFRAGIIQGGTSGLFPGAGDDVAPYMSRCDSAEEGQLFFGGYHGMLYVAPSTVTTIVIQLRSNAPEGWACQQNLTIRYD